MNPSVRCVLGSGIRGISGDGNAARSTGYCACETILLLLNISGGLGVEGEDLLECANKAVCLIEAWDWLVLLGGGQFWLIVFEAEVHVVILRLASNSKSSRL